MFFIKITWFLLFSERIILHQFVCLQHLLTVPFLVFSLPSHTVTFYAPSSSSLAPLSLPLPFSCPSCLTTYPYYMYVIAPRPSPHAASLHAPTLPLPHPPPLPPFASSIALYQRRNGPKDKEHTPNSLKVVLLHFNNLSDTMFLPQNNIQAITTCTCTCVSTPSLQSTPINSLIPGHCARKDVLEQSILK